MTKRVLVGAVAWALAISAAFAEAPWQLLSSERGITVTTRDEPGRDFPTFRGQGVLGVPVLQALAVVLDARGAMEWAVGADEVDLIRALDARSVLLYTRNHAPWPVSDRDLVVKRVVRVLRPAEEFRIDMACIDGQRPKVKRAVRVTDCASHFALRKVDATRTHVEYQVSLDPSGSLPAWLVRWASKRIPFDTLVNLERQVKKSGTKYAAEVQAWAVAR